MPRGRRGFKRLRGERPYKKLFIIATEGAKTEPEYFEIFNTQNNPDKTIKVRCLSHRKDSAPEQVLQRMEKCIRKSSLRGGDDAWVVIDNDGWKQADIKKLYLWSQISSLYNRGFALSNPRFEYWLLLHFEEGKDVNRKNCDERLRKYIPDYDKSIKPKLFPQESIEQAIRRAKLRDTPSCEDWPRGVGTTVYRLVEKILE